MAQTTGATSATNAKIEGSTDGSTWTDISGSTNSIEPGEQTRQSGEAYTFQADTAVITGGKREPLELEIKALYSRVAGEAFEFLRTAFETVPGTFYVRYSPNGGATGDFLFTSGKGTMTSFTYPKAEAEDAKPVPCGCKVKVPFLTKSVLP